YISYPRFSPAGDRIAFGDHPVYGDNRGSLAVIDLDGRKTVLTGDWTGLEGLAWAPSGTEVWFTASRSGALALHAVSLSRRERLLMESPTPLVLRDVWRDGRILLASESVQNQIYARTPGSDVERELTWLGWSAAKALSADGATLLLSRYYDAPYYGAYV